MRKALRVAITLFTCLNLQAFTSRSNPAWQLAVPDTSLLSAFAEIDDIALNKTSHEPSGAMGMTAAHATLRHGELKNVGMPAMTMAYEARDPAMLHQVTAGQNVKLRVDNVDGMKP